MNLKEFWIKRDDIRQLQYVEHELDESLKQDEILLNVESFAFTANNISYAHSGEALGYWQFFPTGDEAWGKLPVWGYGEVLASQNPLVPIGERLYGYFPMASHLKILAGKISESALSDMAAHRQSLSSVYNRYNRVKKTSQEDEALNSLLRPMFTTSFLLDDFLQEANIFGADVILVSSASSKTAYGMAFLLNEHRSAEHDYEIIGLTSPKNIDFVQDLGCYTQVLSYDQLSQLSPERKAVYVDFASNANLRRTIHEHFAENLGYDAIVGGTHWDKLGTAKGLVGVRPEFFFAPTHLQKRISDWGREAYQERLDSAWDSFLLEAKNWIDLEFLTGKEAVEKVYQKMLAGEVDARQGIILAL